MTLFARLTQMLADHRPMLESDDLEAHLVALDRLTYLFKIEADATQMRFQETQLAQVVCCECGSRVLNKPDYLRLKLCTMCMVHGLFARCAFCGENYPEHHPGGRGCSTWERRDDALPDALEGL